jgi:hypothetical protein
MILGVGKGDFRSQRIIVIFALDTPGANMSVVASILAPRPITIICVHLCESVVAILRSRISSVAGSRGITASQGGTADVHGCTPMRRCRASASGCRNENQTRRHLRHKLAPVGLNPGIRGRALIVDGVMLFRVGTCSDQARQYNVTHPVRRRNEKRASIQNRHFPDAKDAPGILPHRAQRYKGGRTLLICRLGNT